MKCLFVRPPFAGYIVDGVKFIEYRTRRTLLRGKIGIIESGSGTVIGDAILWSCDLSGKHEGFYSWYLTNARRYARPIPFKHKKGAMVWINLDIDPEQQAIAPHLNIKELIESFNAYEKDLDAFFAERRKVKP